MKLAISPSIDGLEESSGLAHLTNAVLAWEKVIIRPNSTQLWESECPNIGVRCNIMFFYFFFYFSY
jgi:hypothetical protein